MDKQRIYFMQHGLAVDKTVDPERPLSEAGMAQTKAMAEALLKSKTAITNIFHSGKLRASQTAKIIASVLNITDVSAVDGLSPNDDVSLLAQNLSTEGALYVGHLPHLEKMTAYLVTGDDEASIVKFQNSGVVCLVKADTRFNIRWLLTPDLSKNI